MLSLSHLTSHLLTCNRQRGWEAKQGSFRTGVGRFAAGAERFAAGAVRFVTRAARGGWERRVSEPQRHAASKTTMAMACRLPPNWGTCIMRFFSQLNDCQMDCQSLKQAH